MDFWRWPKYRRCPIISLAKLPPCVITKTSDFRQTKKSRAARLVTCFLKPSSSNLSASSSFVTCKRFPFPEASQLPRPAQEGTDLPYASEELRPKDENHPAKEQKATAHPSRSTKGFRAIIFFSLIRGKTLSM
ncbi:complement component C6 [Striga asiatica]|uniref:Complement component C6 n=1 Tax=Striga asiatica TaxID=4170 RepID=A0A5A7RFP9_STRAF|nr:complement component C6 [Striga asiatica]